MIEIERTDASSIVGGMLDAIQSRGPDGRGTLSFAGGAAGMVRLALLDPSPAGQQPLFAADGDVAILFNGEVYDFREQRSRLLARGHKFHTGTDTEVVLGMYLEHGRHFVEHLRGMYAVAIFDFRERGRHEAPTVVLARDPLGIKPLYLARLPSGGLAFASELKALTASGVLPIALDQIALAQFLANGFVVQPRTILHGVEALSPGVLYLHRPGEQLRQHRFWQMPPHAPRPEGLLEAAARLRSALDESVRLHSFADVPVGAFLSGGIDSAGIVALMTHHVPRLRTYTLRFPDVPGADEAAEAARTAEALGTTHTTVDVDGTEVAGFLPSFARALDQPSSDGLNGWLVARAAARDVKGVLSGLGGDEFFGGYPVTARMARYESRFAGGAYAAAGVVGNALRDFGPRAFRGPARQLAARRSPLARWRQTHGVFWRDEVYELTGMRVRPDADLVALLESFPPPWREETPIGLACRLDVRAYMGCQLLRDADATSMSHSLELRTPLVDIEIAKFSRSCDDRHKVRASSREGVSYRHSGQKRVLIEALKDVLPPGVLDRPKRGFALPLEHWMKGALRPIWRDLLSRDAVVARGLLDPDAVAAEIAAVEAGAPAWPRLWTLLVLELWAQSFLDAPRSPA